MANALAAAALVRAHGVPASAVRAGLRGFTPEAHRIAVVAGGAGAGAGATTSVTWIDDSKATNPHAAQASLAAFESIIWIAGGLAKGASFDELVGFGKSRLKAAILIGADRELIRQALLRHAPEVPVFEPDPADTGNVMDIVVAQAGELARPGDTVLLAPACASMDMFDSYAHRGDVFAAAVHRYLDRRS